MPMQKAIEVTERNFLARDLAELAVYLPGGEDLTLLGARLQVRVTQKDTKVQFVIGICMTI